MRREDTMRTIDNLCEDMLEDLAATCHQGELTVADMEIVDDLRRALQRARAHMAPQGAAQDDRERYEVRVASYAPEGRTRRLTLRLAPANVPSMDSIDLVNGIPQFVQADPFENLAGTVKDAVLNITGNPAEVSVRRDDRKQ